MGIALGILIGLVTGYAFDVLAKTARTGTDAGAAVKLAGALLTLPTCWFGGGWITGSSIVKADDVTGVRSQYVFTLTVVFVPFVLWELYRRAVGGARVAAPAPDA